MPDNSRPPRIGVGLSGGGVRSATFCLGVFQSLANPRLHGSPGRRISQIDYLSTVSGGGYFGSFLGRLFTRRWLSTPSDVGRALRGEQPPEYGPSVFRALRENGRYLAPRGSGDILMLMTIALRNWAAVQVVLLTIAVTAFVALQFVAMSVPGRIAGLVPSIPLTNPRVWWSSWFALLLPVALFWAIPSCWAYWVVGQPKVKQGNWLFRRTDLLVALTCGLALMAVCGSGAAVRVVLVAGIAAVATVVWSVVANRRVIVDVLVGRGEEQVAVDDGNRARQWLSDASKMALLVASAIVVVALVDTLGATLYVLVSTHQVGAWTSSLGAIGTMLLAGGAAFGRQLVVLLDGDSRKGRPKVPLSVVTWLAAIAVLGGWLVVADAASHAIAWRFGVPAVYRPSIVADCNLARAGASPE